MTICNTVASESFMDRVMEKYERTDDREDASAQKNFHGTRRFERQMSLTPPVETLDKVTYSVMKQNKVYLFSGVHD